MHGLMEIESRQDFNSVDSREGILVTPSPPEGFDDDVSNAFKDGTQQIILGIKVVENGAFRGVTQAGKFGHGGLAKSLMSKQACGVFQDVVLFFGHLNITMV